jgi:hypothetical protein
LPPRASPHNLRWRAPFRVRGTKQRPHPRVTYWRDISREDAADNLAAGEHVDIVVILFPEGRLSAARSKEGTLCP